MKKEKLKLINKLFVKTRWKKTKNQEWKLAHIYGDQSIKKEAGKMLQEIYKFTDQYSANEYMKNAIKYYLKTKPKTVNVNKFLDEALNKQTEEDLIRWSKNIKNQALIKQVKNTKDKLQKIKNAQKLAYIEIFKLIIN